MGRNPFQNLVPISKKQAIKTFLHRNSSKFLNRFLISSIFFLIISFFYLTGTNPGLGFRPIADNTEEGSLIWFDAKNETEVAKWTTIIDEFLAREY